MRMAARHDSGILFSHAGNRATHSSNNRPWTIVDSRVLAPDVMLTELRTMTEVTGKPPMRPAVMLPMPWATSSRLVGDTRFCGSNLSTASRFSSVSKEATSAMVTADASTWGS